MNQLIWKPAQGPAVTAAEMDTDHIYNVLNQLSTRETAHKMLIEQASALSYKIPALVVQGQSVAAWRKYFFKELNKRRKAELKLATFVKGD